MGSRRLGYCCCCLLKLAGRSEMSHQGLMSDGYQRRNLCCRQEVKMEIMGSTCIPFRGAIFYFGNCDIPFCRYGLRKTGTRKR
jgi:hypothetical protein